MSVMRDPPPLFDDDESKNDESDIFASAIQSPLNEDLCEASTKDFTYSHPLLDESIGATPKPTVVNLGFQDNTELIGGSTITSSEHDVFESCDQSMLDKLDLKNVSLDNEDPIDQVRADIGGGGGIIDFDPDLDISHGSGKEESSILLFDTTFSTNKEEYINPVNNGHSTPRPHFLSDSDTTEVLLDDTSQEIPLNDDDDGDIFSSPKETKINSNRENGHEKASVLPSVGGPFTEPQSLSTGYQPFSTPSTASNLTSPISPVNTTTILSLTNSTSFEQAERDGGDSFIEIVISDPQKIGDGMGSYMAYKVTTKTTIPYFRKKHWSVTRRFSDFLGLHSKLVEKHLHSGVIIPPAPEKAAIASTKIKLAADKTTDSASAEFIERRRAALERYMNRTAVHQKLRADPDFREFLELDTDLPKATSTSAISGAGVMRLFNRVGESVNKMTFKMDESDQWFEEKTLHIETLDIQLRKLHSAMEGLVNYRRELANSTCSFSKSAAVLSSVEEHTALSRALHQLSEATEKIHTIHHAQADADFFHMSEITKDYINIIGAVKEVFHERVKTFQTWQHAQTTLAKKRENKAKMELTGRQDKVDQANEEVKEWESKVERGQEEFDRISKAIKVEMEQFDIKRIEDFKDMFIKYLEALITSQLQIVKVWETFLPEAKAIA